MSENYDYKISEKKGIGWKIFGWTFFILMFCGVLWFGYRVLFYYQKIRSGEIVELPQYQSRFTASKDAPRLSSNIVERSLVESADNPVLGRENADAKLTIVEFADFECPFSKTESMVVRTLMAKYGDKVRFIYRDYPIESIHPSAFQASVAAECGREQGKFWAYHDKLYGNSGALGYKDLIRYAEEVGLDKKKFESCLAENRYKDVVMKDVEAAKAFGVEGTPTFFFNGQRVEGAIPADVFEKVIQRFLK